MLEFPNKINIASLSLKMVSFVLFTDFPTRNRGSYMRDHVLLNLFNKLRKRDKMQGLSSILSLFSNEFNKFINTGAQMLDSVYHMKLF